MLMMHNTRSSSEASLHVHNLPQLYTKPNLEELLTAISLLKTAPTSFSSTGDPSKQQRDIDPDGIPRYLTGIVSSALSWLPSDEAREQVWDAASARLSERSGRNAMPSMTRSFVVNDSLTIELFEPSLTEDNLGLKTWTSSLLLARRLPQLHRHLPPSCKRVLELGAGTGLVGIAAACTWGLDVLLTDLPEIVPNLQRNIDSNRHLLQHRAGSLTACALDWSDPSCTPGKEEERFDLILAADPIYTSDHPRMLVDTVCRWLERGNDARFVVELPLRAAYQSERDELRERLHEIGLRNVAQGVETGYDDWQGKDGRPAEVECWWGVWGRISI